MSTKFMYLRATRQQQPVGCLAYTIDPKSNTVSYQVSVVNPTFYLKPGGAKVLSNGREYTIKDRQVRDAFDRTSARDLAAAALTNSPFTCNVNGEVDLTAPDCWEITVAAMSHLAQNRKVPGRAMRVAGDWMRANGFVKVNKTWVLKAQK